MAPSDDDAAPGAGADATAGGPAADAEPDPALSYPRGNRLGLRHPRPTVVIVVAVLVVLGGAFVWKEISSPKEGRFCNATGAIDTPTAPTAEMAFQRWFDQMQAAGPRALQQGSPPMPANADAFDRDGDTWTYRVGGHGVQVVVGPGYRVTGANACTWQTMP